MIGRPYRQSYTGTEARKGFALSRTAMICLPLLLLQHHATASAVRITKRTGCVIDSAQVVQDFVLAGGLGSLNENASFALSDDARFARASWDCGAWGTQGELITQKVLSLGGAVQARLVRRWLMNTPQLPSGEVFSTEGGRLHVGQDGKWWTRSAEPLKDR